MKAQDFYILHTKTTRSLKKFIADYEEQLDVETFESFLDLLSEELFAAKDEILALPAGDARAKKLQDMVDAEIENGADIPVSCTKGCSACCHMEVEITNYEADVLAKIVSAGHIIDRPRLEKQSQRKLQDPQWKQGPRNQESQCVFLNSEGACSIYENRPVMCRRHSVTSPAINCYNLDAPITLRYFPRVDLFISAANEDANLSIGPMAKMLQIRL